MRKKLLLRWWGIVAYLDWMAQGRIPWLCQYAGYLDERAHQ